MGRGSRLQSCRGQQGHSGSGGQPQNTQALIKVLQRPAGKLHWAPSGCGWTALLRREPRSPSRSNLRRTRACLQGNAQPTIEEDTQRAGGARAAFRRICRPAQKRPPEGGPGLRCIGARHYSNMGEACDVVRDHAPLLAQLAVGMQFALSVYLWRAVSSPLHGTWTALPRTCPHRTAPWRPAAAAAPRSAAPAGHSLRGRQK